MAQPIVDITDSFKIFKDKVNEISTNLGDPALLNTDNKSVLVTAVSELETAIRGANLDYTLHTSSQAVISAINEIHAELYDSGATFTGLAGSHFTAAIEELRVELGNHTTLATDVKTDAVNAINELETAIRGSLSNYSLSTTATNIVAAINEHETDIGDMGLLTTSVDLTEAINEHEADIGSMSLDTTSIDLTDAINEHEDDLYTSTTGSFTGLTSKHFKGAIEELRSELGYHLSLNTVLTTVVPAVNEVHDELDSASGELEITKVRLVTTNHKIGSDSASASWHTLDTTAHQLIPAINEHEDDLYTSTTGTFDGLTSKHFKGAIEEIVDELGQVTTLSTSANVVVTAINELHAEVNTLDARLDSAEPTLLATLQKIGVTGANPTAWATLNTVGSTIVDAINENHSQLDSASNDLINIKDNIVGHREDLAAFYDSAGATTNIVGALNHLAGRFIRIYDESGVLIN